MYIDQNELLDPNLYEIIVQCVLHKRSSIDTEIVVTYENGDKERIWTFDRNRYSFNYRDFIGMTKIQAVFYCDRKSPRRMR
jgi:hypothetical protein